MSLLKEESDNEFAGILTLLEGGFCESSWNRHLILDYDILVIFSTIHSAPIELLSHYMHSLVICDVYYNNLSGTLNT